MTNKRLKTLKDRVAYRIARSKFNVFVREDFAALGGYDQIGRALRELVADHKLIKIGYGLYTRAQISPLSGRVIPTKTLSILAKEALERLGLEVSASSFDNSPDQARSALGRVLVVDGRISRKIGYEGKYIHLERSNARDKGK